MSTAGQRHGELSQEMEVESTGSISYAPGPSDEGATSRQGRSQQVPSQTTSRRSRSATPTGRSSLLPNTAVSTFKRTPRSSPKRSPQGSGYVGPRIAALQDQLTRATEPIASQIAATSQSVNQSRSDAANALRVAQEAQAQTATVQSAVTETLRQHLAATSELTQTRVDTVAGAMAQQMSNILTQAQMTTRHQHE